MTMAQGAGGRGARRPGRTRSWKAPAAAALACCLVQASWATPGSMGAELRDFSARYEGSKHFGPLTARARAQIRLQRSGRHIVYTMDTTVSLAFIERSFHDCSVIRIEGDELQPVEYAHLDAAEPRHNVRTRFDWSSGQAHTLVGLAADSVTVPIVWPTWDPMSFQVALMALAPGRAAGEREVHRLVERGTIKVHRVRFSGVVASAEGVPQSPLYEVVSQKEGSGKGRIVLLLTPQPSWRPVRVTIEDVTIELVGAAPASPLSSLSDEPAPRCRSDPPK